MRILQMISQYPGKTGSGTYLQAILKHGNLEGHEMGLVAGFSHTSEVSEMKIPNLFSVVFNTELLPFPIPGMSDTMPYPSTKYSEMNEVMFTAWVNAFTAVIMNAVDSFKPDMIISHHLWILTALVKKLYPKLPLIAICHGTDLVQFSKAPVFRDYVVSGCKELKVVFALNDIQRKTINSYYEIPIEHIKTIGGGYDSDIFFKSPVKPHHKNVKIIYAGKLSFSKGVPSLIRAFEKLQARNKNIELLLAGTGCGYEEEQIKKQIIEASANIKLLGQVPHGKLGEVFRECDIFVLPSFYEGLSLVTIEALACGLGVVATDNEGLKNLLGDRINTSGIIEYVKLPPMEKIDTPLSGYLNSFEDELVRALEVKIATLEKVGSQYEVIKEKLEQLSWSKIFLNIKDALLINNYTKEQNEN